MAAETTTTHHIVAIEAVHSPIPEFNLPVPHTRAVHRWTDPADLPSRLKDATIAITTTIRLTAETLSPEVTPKLRLIVIMATGTDCVDIAAATARGITVCNCPGSNVDSVSEHAIGLYFAARRKFVELHNATVAVPADPSLDTEWKTNGSLLSRVRAPDGTAPLLCSDETVCIVGYGSLGKRIEALAKGLGMKVIIAERKGVASRDGRFLFEDALKKATVVVLCLPRSAETLNMISAAELRIMSPHAVLVNVARGGIVDEQALLDALKGGVIAGAATDVYAIEPAGRGDSPLLGPDAKGLNLVLTPHLAWYAERTLRNLQATVKETTEKWCAGESINQVR
ncbi:D-isomer specific 2-hydroxyacid dehydrogenaseNAD-binding [Penicillium sp. IBT 31633x]|nr:D-isomer specific 2-hydroxyacid dehydrogenaseNAD-binding [Penicillium sp. IBT 31633x]